MVNGLLHQLYSFIPHRKNEEILLDTHNIIEELFLFVLNIFRKISLAKLERKNGSIIGNFLSDLGVIFSVLETVSLVLLTLPALVFPNDLEWIIYFSQISVIIFFISILLVGFVYLNEAFRNLIRTKILSVQFDHEQSSEPGYYSLIRRIFNGTYLEWQSGKGFRFHWRSILYLAFIIPIGLKVFCTPFFQLLFQIFTNYRIDWIISLILLIFSFVLAALFILIILYTLVTVFFVLIFLLGTASDYPLEINPWIEMGGTKDYGDIVIKCVYLASFSLASFPLLSIVSDLGMINQIDIVQFKNQTFGNITSEFKNSLIHSVEEMSIDSFSTYFSSFVILFFVIIASIIIMVVLHYRIKQRKQELIQGIESQIISIDFVQTQSQNDRERFLYLLGIYEKIIRSSEWPIKKMFVIELIISTVPIIVTHLL